MAVTITGEAVSAGDIVTKLINQPITRIEFIESGVFIFETLNNCRVTVSPCQDITKVDFSKVNTLTCVSVVADCPTGVGGMSYSTITFDVSLFDVLSDRDDRIPITLRGNVGEDINIHIESIVKEMIDDRHRCGYDRECY